MRSRLRRYFIAGLIVFLPVAITVSIIVWLFRVVDSFLGWLLPLTYGRAVPGVGFITSIVLIFLIGALATNVVGRRLVGFFEGLMLRIPLARSIYSATKSISHSIFVTRNAAFRRAVLVEWPRKGIFTIGFVTGESQGAPGGRALNVFVVTTPNPTTGFMMIVPEGEVHALGMTVEDALQLVISGGIVSPDLKVLPRTEARAGPAPAGERV